MLAVTLCCIMLDDLGSEVKLTPSAGSSASCFITKARRRGGITASRAYYTIVHLGINVLMMCSSKSPSWEHARLSSSVTFLTLVVVGATASHDHPAAACIYVDVYLAGVL